MRRSRSRGPLAGADSLSSLATDTFVGHALIPSFIGDMEKPQDFPKALGISMTAQLVLYTITGAVVYHYTGTSCSIFFDGAA